MTVPLCSVTSLTINKPEVFLRLSFTLWYLTFSCFTFSICSFVLSTSEVVSEFCGVAGLSGPFSQKFPFIVISSFPTPVWTCQFWNVVSHMDDKSTIWIQYEKCFSSFRYLFRNTPIIDALNFPTLQNSSSVNIGIMVRSKWCNLTNYIIYHVYLRQAIMRLDN